MKDVWDEMRGSSGLYTDHKQGEEVREAFKTMMSETCTSLDLILEAISKSDDQKDEVRPLSTAQNDLFKRLDNAAWKPVSSRLRSKASGLGAAAEQ